MSTTNNNCFCLDQFLEADAPEEFIIINNQGSPAAFENGIFSLGQGVDSAQIFFTTVKLSDEYTFNELAIENTVDVSPLTILVTLVSHSRNGFSVILNGLTDSPNYNLRWEVNVVEIA